MNQSGVASFSWTLWAAPLWFQQLRRRDPESVPAGGGGQEDSVGRSPAHQGTRTHSPFMSLSQTWGLIAAPTTGVENSRKAGHYIR